MRKLQESREAVNSIREKAKNQERPLRPDKARWPVKTLGKLRTPNRPKLDHSISRSESLQALRRAKLKNYQHPPTFIWLISRTFLVCDPALNLKECYSINPRKNSQLTSQLRPIYSLRTISTTGGLPQQV